eukprot:CAMPEP_0195520050 /NCGR_PEP_ID=MMETSP0794_2-20130614/16001_1 /TAXON_ID=515487 /ORGANISM="Stephanopyxis turris, Strain CCMP 815" /LENGTH=102 /DNA_ID=CAMNT_0040649319 /DNA_START=40 /DNA_END=348 /DNA_ORIENTATION=+
MAEQTPLSRDTLTGLHKILAVECHDQILAYNEVKGRNHDNPAASVEQGAAVRACYHKTYTKVAKACKNALDSYGECMKDTAGRFQKCRAAQQALRECYWNAK